MRVIYCTRLLIVLFLAGSTSAWCQLRSFTILAGGELSTHRLVSPNNAGGLEFEFEFGQLDAEAEQSFFVGAKADWTIKDQIGLQTQVDYGRVIYNVFFREPSETNGIFGPQTRGVFYAPNRLDFSVLPTYTLDLNNFWITPKIGVTYSFPVKEEDYIDKIPERTGQERAVTIENALNRSFGGPVWKLNVGIDIGYERFSVFANLRHQISSASNNPVEVEEVNLTVPFDNRLTALQFGLGYRVF